MIGIDEVIRRYGKTRNGRMITLGNLDKYPEWKPTNEDFILEQWHFPAGTRLKAFETKNFGWVVLAPEQKTVQGFIAPKRIFKW